MSSSAMVSVRRSRARFLSIAAAAALFGAPSAFVASGDSRRALLSGGVLGAMIGSPASSQAAEMLFLGKPRGPFELNPKDAVIVGDAKSADAQAARQVVAEMQTEAEEALAALKKDPQADVFLNVKPLAIARLRDATNKINNLMDEKSAAATQRWQRLMIQAKYQFEDDAPMPETKKGDVRPRGDKRLARIKEALENYLKGSREILKFM